MQTEAHAVKGSSDNTLVVLIAPLPPPAGGIARWTEGLLQFAAGDPFVEIVVIDSAARYRPIWNLSVLWRIVGGTVHGIALFSRVSRILLARNPDVVHITTSGSFGMLRDLLFISLARAMGIPAVLHMRGGRPPQAVAANHWEAKLARVTFRLAGSAIVLDAASEKAIRSQTHECSVSIIENPAWKLVAAPGGTNHDVSSRTIVFAGWVIPAKGIRELVLACRDLEDHGFRLDLIGPVEQAFKRELMSLAESKEKGEWLTIHGELAAEETLARIANGAFLVLPSYTEGCPNVVLEAMMLGKAVIATPVGAIPNLLAFGSEDQRCGVQVAVRDSGSLAEAIKFLLRNPGTARALGERARARVEAMFSPQVIYPRYRTIWERLAATRHAESNAGNARSKSQRGVIPNDRV
jgi:glycosyltransferase involved in cell wall biosynthesis